MILYKNNKIDPKEQYHNASGTREYELAHTEEENEGKNDNYYHNRIEEPPDRELT